MPVINVNGKFRHITWERLSTYATMIDVTAETFLTRYGKPTEGHQGLPFHVTPAALATAAAQLNTTDWFNQNTPVGNAVPVNTATPQTEDTMATTPFTAGGLGHVPSPQELSAFINSISNVKERAAPTPNSNSLLQDIVKYKAMTLRKNESNAFEKMHTLKEKPMEWCTTQGMVGIEIEVENITNSLHPLAYWDVKADGSLRNNGVELVSVPLQIKQVQLALEHVYNVLTANNKPDFSNRTSVHIHVNCRDLTQNQIYNFILLYTLFEKHFYAFAGNKRMNSIFCVPLFRTNQLNVLDNVVYGLSPNWHKYCGINLLPLYENHVTRGYGTIEFRHLYGTSNQREILEWINDIMCLRKYACEISKDDLLKNIKEMNTTSSYISLYSQVFAKGRKVLSNKKDFEECVSNIKRELFGDEYLNTVKRSDQSDYWIAVNSLGIRG